MDIGISTLVDLDVSMPELLSSIAGAGFKYVSFSHDIDHADYHLPRGRELLRQWLDKASLKLNYIHAPIQRYYDLTSLDTQVRRATIEVLKIVIDACTALDGQAVVMHLMNGHMAEGESVGPRVAAGVESLKELLDYAGQREVRLDGENLPLNIDCGVVSLALLRATADWPELGVCLDTCHAYIDNDEPLKLIAELAPRIRATHFSDTLGVYDSHLLLGDVMVDFPAVAHELGTAGFDGIVDLECSLWMLRNRVKRNSEHPGDTVPPSTDHYLERAAEVASQIAEDIENARKQ